MRTSHHQELFQRHLFRHSCIVSRMPTESTGVQAALTVAAEIRAVLARHLVAQTALVRRLGVSRPWLVRRLSGETPLTMTVVATIAELLDVPVAQLVAPVDTNGSA